MFQEFKDGVPGVCPPFSFSVCDSSYISCSLVLFSCLYADLASVNLIPKTIFPSIQFCCSLTYLVYISNVTNVSVKIKERATNLGILLVKDSYLILLFNNQPSMIKLNMRKLWCILDMVTFFLFNKWGTCPVCSSLHYYPLLAASCLPCTFDKHGLCRIVSES